MTKTKLQIMREKAEYDIGELADITNIILTAIFIIALYVKLYS